MGDSSAVAAANEAHWQDGANWWGPSHRLPLIYWCDQDTRAWVPKRVGFGYTCNFARTEAKVTMLGLAGFVGFVLMRAKMMNTR